MFASVLKVVFCLCFSKFFSLSFLFYNQLFSSCFLAFMYEDWTFICHSCQPRRFFLLVAMLTIHSACLVTQSCPTPCIPMGCCLPDSSVHELLQARILEWIAIPFSRRPSWPRDWTAIRLLYKWILYCLSRQGSLQYRGGLSSIGAIWKRLSSLPPYLKGLRMSIRRSKAVKNPAV